MEKILHSDIPTHISRWIVNYLYREVKPSLTFEAYSKNTARLNREYHKEESYRRFSSTYIFEIFWLLRALNSSPTSFFYETTSISIYNTYLARWALTGTISMEVLLSTVHSVEPRIVNHHLDISIHNKPVPVVKHFKILGAYLTFNRHTSIDSYLKINVWKKL